MKITRSQLKQIIKEELTQAGDWSDEKDRPWDSDLKVINNAFADIALGAIDYYNYETQEDARAGITRELQAAFDNFVDEDIAIRGGLEDILDEEFAAETEEDPLALPRPTQDPMGRGPETSDLRRRAMRREQ